MPLFKKLRAILFVIHNSKLSYGGDHPGAGAPKSLFYVGIKET